MTQLECAAILFDLDGVLIDSTAVITRHRQEDVIYGKPHPEPYLTGA